MSVVAAQPAQGNRAAASSRLGTSTVPPPENKAGPDLERQVLHGAYENDRPYDDGRSSSSSSTYTNLQFDFFKHRKIVDPAKRREVVQREVYNLSFHTRIDGFELFFGRKSSGDDDDFYESEDNAEIHELLSAAVGKLLSHSRPPFVIKSVEGPSVCYFRMFTDSLASMGQTTDDREPIDLCFDDTIVDVNVNAATLIAPILVHNGFVGAMQIYGCQMGTAGLQLIVDSMGTNEYIRELSVHDETVTVASGTIAHAVDATSPLTVLCIGVARWTEEALVSLWTHLRTNQRLSRLEIGGLDQDQEGIVTELARDTIAKYNWTLVSVEYNCPYVFSDLEEINAKVREVASELEAKEYLVDQVATWPSIMGLVSSKPTLLYRFLRRKNSASFCSVALALNARRAVIRKRPLSASAATKDDAELL